MEKNYREIEFQCGETIDSAMKYLKSLGEITLACGSFNGHMLYSDVDDIDSAYLKITGNTKAQQDEYNRKWLEEYKLAEKKNIKKLFPT